MSVHIRKILYSIENSPVLSAVKKGFLLVIPIVLTGSFASVSYTHLDVYKRQVIDYGAGNLQSVEKALRHIGCACEITADPECLLSADAAILPGVGAFGDAMENLRSRGLEKPILQFSASGKPFLGICLGLQILFENSEESPEIPGLGILKGKIVRLPAESGLKIPHIGWNSLHLEKSGGLFQGLTGEPYVYFVHSYYPVSYTHLDVYKRQVRG